MLAALGWALFAAHEAKMAGSTGEALLAAKTQFDSAYPLLGRISAFFAVGVLLLVALLGTSGWLHSRRVGIVTLVLALFFAGNVISILRPFIV